MRTTSIGFALLAFASTCLPANAANTADDAAKLQSSLQAYLGSGADAVKVTPDGDGFKATLDLTGLMAKGNMGGTEVTITPIELNLTPEPGGKWKIKREGPFSITSKLAGEFTLTENVESYNITGEYDEALGALSTFDMTGKNITFTEEMTGKTGTPIKADGKFDSISATGTATANPAGGVDIKIAEPLGPMMINETIGAPQDSPMTLQFKSTGGNFDVQMNGARTLNFLDLLKFSTAHQGKDAMVKDQAAFKTVLTNVLPVFANVASSGSLNKLEMQTPMGVASAEKISFGSSVNGLVKDGKASQSLAVDGLVLPPGLAPSWAASLLPKNFSIGVAVTGYDAATVANTSIAAMDLAKDPALAKDVSDRLIDLLLPKGTVDVTFDKTSVNNDTYAISADGSFQAGPAAVPSGKAHVTAKGLDDIMKAVQASPPEVGIQGTTAMIIAAKGMAKAQPDGSLAWDVEATPDGKVLVNGVDISALGK